MPVAARSIGARIDRSGSGGTAGRCVAAALAGAAACHSRQPEHSVTQLLQASCGPAGRTSPQRALRLSVSVIYVHEIVQSVGHSVSARFQLGVRHVRQCSIFAEQRV